MDVDFMLIGKYFKSNDILYLQISAWDILLIIYLQILAWDILVIIISGHSKPVETIKIHVWVWHQYLFLCTDNKLRSWESKGYDVMGPI